MKCLRCQHENRSGRRFCAECGGPLAPTCSACGSQNEPGEKFCGDCGGSLAQAKVDDIAPERAPRAYTPKHLADKILQSKSALEGERKQVTVLFADVTGSMELAEQLDPEVWHTILDRFFQILSDGVHRFEGTVNQYTGDGIMALFGAPISHEDHAQRACFAALHLKNSLRKYADELRRTRGLSFSTRIGINSGEVVVGKIGDDLRMDYTAQGQTVGLAQRMEALAEPGCVYLAEGSRRLVEGYFDLRPLGDFTVKGVSDPVPVYELQGQGTQRTRLDRSRARGFSRFVGRKPEFESLQHALEQSLAGHGRVVGVMADAGTGKSRLCDEFIEDCRRREIRVLAGHCPAHGQSVAFLPILELLRQVFGIAEGDSDLEVRRKIAGELTLLDADFQPMLPALFDFLGVPDPARPASGLDSEERERKLLGFIRHLVQARSEREPGVIFVDDLHWVDPGSEAFIAQLVEIAAATRTLVLVNFRPEYRADWMQQSHYQQVPLDPLGKDEVKELVTDLLGGHASLAGLADHVYGRTGGNPFFVEEIVQSLVESGRLEGSRGSYQLVGSLGELEIPATVHAVLAARIDRLAERDKRLLQVASVIGREVPEPLLADVAELPAPELAAALSTLQRGEFLLQQVLFPEAEYIFKHALTLDVAYDSQLAEPRARLHAAAARAVEKRAGERLDENAGLLAHHWESAGEAVTAAGWHVRASHWAGLTQGTEMVRHLRKALELLDSAPRSTEAVTLAAEALSLMLGFAVRAGTTEDGERLIERADELATSSADPLVQAHLEYGISAHLLFTNRVPAAFGHLTDAVRFADAAEDPDLQVAARFNLGVCHWFMGSLSDARGSLRAAIELVSKEPGSGTSHMGYDSKAGLLSMLGLFEAIVGNCREAVSFADRAIERARECDAPSRVLAYAWAARGAAYSGDRERSLSRGQRALEIAEPISTRNIQAIAMVGLASARMANEQWAEAAELLDRVLAETPVYFHTFIGRARVLLEVGPPEAALLAAEEHVALCLDLGARLSECEGRVHLAEILMRLHTPPRDRIDDELKRAAALIEATGARILRPRIHEIRAVLNPEARGHELHEAQRLYAEMESAHADRVARELAT
jgi:class 3 adenylate cyclase/tetratricopeptide (TPR) repeat protein